MQLILASASPRRKELLARAGFVFRVHVPRQVREISSAPNPDDVAVINAGLKADAAAAEFPDALVIGADTIIRFGNEILGKPRDLADAFAMLKKLSGATHRVLTGVAIRGPNGSRQDFTESSSVTFRALSDTEIKSYLAEVNVLDKAGSYAIQEHGDKIIQAIEGDFDNIVGLPSRVAAFLNEAALRNPPEAGATRPRTPRPRSTREGGGC